MLEMVLKWSENDVGFQYEGYSLFRQCTVLPGAKRPISPMACRSFPLGISGSSQVRYRIWNTMVRQYEVTGGRASLDQCTNLQRRGVMTPDFHLSGSSLPFNVGFRDGKML